MREAEAETVMISTVLGAIRNESLPDDPDSATDAARSSATPTDAPG
jgi:hypothetical protein